MTPIRHRSLASACFVVLFSVAAVALLGTTLFSLAQNVLMGQVTTTVKMWQHLLTVVPGPSTPQSRQPTAEPMLVMKPDDLSPFTIVIDRIVPSRGIVEGDIAVDITCEPLRNIIEKNTKEPVFSFDNDGGPATLKTEFQDSSIFISIFDMNGGSIQKYTAPLSAFGECGQGGAGPSPFGPWSSPVEFPVIGNATAYPQDWYIGEYFVVVTLDKNLERVIFPWEPGLENNSLPIQPYIAVGPGMAGTDVRIEPGEVHLMSPGHFFPRFIIQRSLPTVLFAYFISAIPLVLALLLLHILFLAPPAGEEPVHNLLINVAAAMLAVLPLRQVLVPAEIVGTTRIDLLLGFGISLIIALALVRYIMIILGSRVPGNPEVPVHKSIDGTTKSAS